MEKLSPKNLLNIMKINCIVEKDFNIPKFIDWLKIQSSEYKDYFESFSYQLIDKYIISVYPEVSCIDDFSTDELVIAISNALNSNI